MDNEWHSWQNRPERGASPSRPEANQFGPKPAVPEDTLKSGQVEIERKLFTLVLKENLRGRLLRITEENQGRRNIIIIPSTGLKAFQSLLAEMILASETTPPVQPGSPL